MNNTGGLVHQNVANSYPIAWNRSNAMAEMIWIWELTSISKQIKIKTIVNHWTFQFLLYDLICDGLSQNVRSIQCFVSVIWLQCVRIRNSILSLNTIFSTWKFTHVWVVGLSLRWKEICSLNLLIDCLITSTKRKNKKMGAGYLAHGIHRVWFVNWLNLLFFYFVWIRIWNFGNFRREIHCICMAFQFWNGDCTSSRFIFNANNATSNCMVSFICLCENEEKMRSIKMTEKIEGNRWSTSNQSGKIKEKYTQIRDVCTREKQIDQNEAPMHALCPVPYFLVWRWFKIRKYEKLPPTNEILIWKLRNWVHSIAFWGHSSFESMCIGVDCVSVWLASTYPAATA